MSTPNGAREKGRSLSLADFACIDPDAASPALQESDKEGGKRHGEDDGEDAFEDDSVLVADAATLSLQDSRKETSTGPGEGMGEAKCVLEMLTQRAALWLGR